MSLNDNGSYSKQNYERMATSAAQRATDLTKAIVQPRGIPQVDLASGELKSAGEAGSISIFQRRTPIQKQQANFQSNTMQTLIAQNAKFKSDAYTYSSQQEEDKFLSTLGVNNSDTIDARETREFLTELGMRESSGRYNVVNSKGYGGKYQAGNERLTDWKKDTGTEINFDSFVKSPAAQEKFALWHIQDIDNLYMENEIKMPLNSFRAVAHLGGKTGALKYAKTRDLPFGHPDKYNPHDGGKKKIGTYLSDYDTQFGGNS